MKKTILILFLFFALPMAMATDVCLDFDSPSAPTGLDYSGNVLLTWTGSADSPSCSGIHHYDVYRDGEFIGSTSVTSYNDDAMPDGTYVYDVSAVDNAGNEGEKTSLTVTLGGDSGGNPGGGSPGGGGGGRDRDEDDQDIETFEEPTIEPTEGSDTSETTPKGTQNNGLDDEGNLITGAAVFGGENAGAFTIGIIVLVIIILLALYFGFFRKKGPSPV